MATAWIGPLPPNASIEKSLGSRPRYVETARIARIIVTLATVWTP